MSKFKKKITLEDLKNVTAGAADLRKVSLGGEQKFEGKISDLSGRHESEGIVESSTRETASK